MQTTTHVYDLPPTIEGTPDGRQPNQGGSRRPNAQTLLAVASMLAVILIWAAVLLVDLSGEYRTIEVAPAAAMTEGSGV